MGLSARILNVKLLINIDEIQELSFRKLQLLWETWCSEMFGNYVTHFLRYEQSYCFRPTTILVQLPGSAVSCAGSVCIVRCT
jgi:hypothetical protein